MSKVNYKRQVSNVVANIVDFSDGFVYVIELSKPLGNERHSAKFYTGWSIAPEARLRHHRNGTAKANFTAKAVEAGAELNIVAIVPGSKSLERAFKKENSASRVVARLLKYGLTWELWQQAFVQGDTDAATRYAEAAKAFAEAREKFAPKRAAARQRAAAQRALQAAQ